MRHVADVRGFGVTELAGIVSFTCEGEPMPDAPWNGPKGFTEDGQPKSHVGMSDACQDTGLAQEVARALENAEDV